jgi:acyl-CoA thioester hydrolase
MLRLDRRRLDAASFPVRIEIATRFDDLDLQGHVNNVAVAVILQEARGRFNQQFIAGLLGTGRGMVVGSLFIDYAAEMYAPDPVDVRTGVLDIGRSSFTLGQVARQRGRTTAYAEVAMVITGSEGATPIPDAARNALQAARIVPETVA